MVLGRVGVIWPHPLPASPVGLVLLIGWRPLLVHLGVEAVQLLGHGRRRGGRATDEGLRRGLREEVVNAGVVGVTVVVLHIRDGG